MSTKESSPGRKGSIMANIFKVFSSSQQDTAAPVEISTPYNFKHVQHVQIDARTSTGFSVSNTSYCISTPLSPFNLSEIYLYLNYILSFFIFLMFTGPA